MDEITIICRYTINHQLRVDAETYSSGLMATHKNELVNDMEGDSHYEVVGQSRSRLPQKPSFPFENEEDEYITMCSSQAPPTPTIPPPTVSIRLSQDREVETQKESLYENIL